MVQFIDDQRDAYGVESICPVVPRRCCAVRKLTRNVPYPQTR